MKNIFVLTVLIATLFTSCSKDDDNPSNNTGCDTFAAVITEEKYNEISTSRYNVIDAQLKGDCLEMTISSSGCDPEPWVMNLFSTDSFYNTYPLERAVKIELINNQLCQAVFQKTVSFDLTPFQIEGQSEVPLNIENWDKQILYKYPN